MVAGNYLQRKREKMPNIIKSLCDTDLYKISMMQFAFHQFPNSVVEYDFKCRNEDVDLTPIMPEVRLQVDFLSHLRFTEDELDFLHNYGGTAGGVFKDDFIKYLRTFKLNTDQVKIYRDENNKMAIKVSGLWTETILYEIFILSIVNESYFRMTQPYADKNFGLMKLYKKIDQMKHSVIPFQFMEFGTRRRYSQKWQETVIRVLRDNASHYLIGTSNVDIGRRLGVKVLGTQAHELFSFSQSISYEQCHQLTLDNWKKEFGSNFMIALSDIYGTDAFLKDFSLENAHHYHGLRHDSGDPIEWVNKVLNFYKKNNIDPLSKVAIFSDGLDIKKALEINDYCFNKIKVAFGIGTSISNDFDFKPLNIVMKMIKANNKPVVKISDQPSKAIGDKKVIESIINYYKNKKESN